VTTIIKFCRPLSGETLGVIASFLGVDMLIML